MIPLLVVVVCLKVKRHRTSEFLDAIRLQAQRSLRDEPGCLRFDVNAVNGEPTQYILYETYADTAAFDRHRETPHYMQWRIAASEVIENEGQTTILCTPIDQLKDQSGVEPGPKRS